MSNCHQNRSTTFRHVLSMMTWRYVYRILHSLSFRRKIKTVNSRRPNLTIQICFRISAARNFFCLFTSRDRCNTARVYNQQQRWSRRTWDVSDFPMSLLSSIHFIKVTIKRYVTINTETGHLTLIIGRPFSSAR